MAKIVACGPAVNLIFNSDFPHFTSREMGRRYSGAMKLSHINPLLLCCRTSAPELHLCCMYGSGIFLILESGGNGTQVRRGHKIDSYNFALIMMAQFSPRITEREGDAGAQGPQNWLV